MPCGFFHLTPLSYSLPGEGQSRNDNEGARYFYRSLFFDKRIRSGCTAKGRQQAAGAGQAERTDGLQTRRQGQWH
jgi:hypothetical protein